MPKLRTTVVIEDHRTLGSETVDVLEAAGLGVAAFASGERSLDKVTFRDAHPRASVKRYELGSVGAR